MKSSRGTAIILIALAIAILYGRTLGYGLVWDDFAALRPRSWSVILGAWTGPWDPGSVWPVFYRPLSIAAYSTMFRWFGHNALQLHAVNLAELFAAAWMLRSFVRREVNSNRLGLIAALLLVLHPETPSSLAAWISQQFHLLALIASIAAALTWQRVRHRSASRWAIVLLPIALGVPVKEDVLMIAPTLLAWQFIRARVVGDVPSINRASISFVGCAMAIYAVWRSAALHAIGGYGTPGTGRILINLVEGPIFTFGLQWIPSAHWISLAAGIGVAALAVLAWRARRFATPQQISLAAYGAALGVFANVPLILVSGHTRLYLLIFAAVLVFTAAIGITAGAAECMTGAQQRTLAAAAVALGLLVAAANWTNTNTFAPCSAETLLRNNEALDWHIMTPQMRAEVQSTLDACGAPPPVRVRPQP